MVLKIFRAVWFLSALAVLAVLLLIYASLPENVTVYEERAGNTYLSRDTFFFVAIMVLAVVNVMVYPFSKVYKREDDLRTWFYGLIVALNVFFVIAFSLINVYNSSEKFNYADIGFAVYGSVLLFVLWALSWPVYRIFKKFTAKQIV